VSIRHNLPLPPSILSAIPMGVMEVEIEIPMDPPLPLQREDIEKQWAYQEAVREEADTLMESALHSLRVDGASEQQLGALISAVRLHCLLKVLDLDVSEVARRHHESHGITLSPNRALAAALVPELKDLL